jgi:virulence-associated protein VagC
MPTVRIIKSGNSQVVRFPPEFRIKTKMVEIYRDSGDIVLREVPTKKAGRNMVGRRAPKKKRG